MRKKYNKYLFLLDRFPYVLIILILCFALIFFFIFKNRIPLDFFSGAKNTQVSEEESSYSIFITSPLNDKIYNFINQVESVPIIIKSKEAEDSSYSVRVLVNDQEIKVFSSPPYEYKWVPGESGEYEIMALILDDSGEVISESNRVNFLVEYEEETEGSEIISMDVEEKKNAIIEEANFRTQNTIPPGVPIFSYKCYTPPSIDGSFEEWEKFEKFSSFEPTIKKENYTTHTDVSGIFYSCWNEDNFYFLIQVVDDVFNQSYSGNQLNKGDSITLVFDTAFEEDMQTSFYNSDDYQIDFSPGNFAGIPEESFMNWPSNAPPKGVSVASTRLTNGYIIEASIPWYNFINYTPSDGDVIGFTVSILDTDYLETTELVISSSRVFDLNNVSTLGAIALIDAGDIQTLKENGTEENQSGE
ncbi:MAG: hypothetical protein JW770_04560 [Actinobacteria bacterium]|nr:hypothetical protein [Actinomycetota bacterium]